MPTSHPAVATPRTGPHTLQQLCLGVLGEHLEELLQLEEDVLPLLPTHAKSVLLAAANKRGLLANR
jgi:hypothetical protein